jgi:hypothetical protein
LLAQYFLIYGNAAGNVGRSHLITVCGCDPHRALPQSIPATSSGNCLIRQAFIVGEGAGRFANQHEREQHFKDKLLPKFGVGSACIATQCTTNVAQIRFTATEIFLRICIVAHALPMQNLHWRAFKLPYRAV